MKNCTTYTAIWDFKRNPDSFRLPEKCLSYTISNKGNSSVLIDETETLETGEYYPVEHHVGYYHKGQVKIAKANDNDKPLIHFRITVEINE